MKPSSHSFLWERTWVPLIVPDCYLTLCLQTWGITNECQGSACWSLEKGTSPASSIRHPFPLTWLIIDLWHMYLTSPARISLTSNAVRHYHGILPISVIMFCKCYLYHHIKAHHWVYYCNVNNYWVGSYRIVIVVTNSVTKRTNFKAMFLSKGRKGKKVNAQSRLYLGPESQLETYFK